MVVELTDRGSAYVRYLNERPILRTVEVARGIQVDLNYDELVIGIEIDDVGDRMMIDFARDFALAARLRFPRDLTAAAESARAA